MVISTRPPGGFEVFKCTACAVLSENQEDVIVGFEVHDSWRTTSVQRSIEHNITVSSREPSESSGAESQSDSRGVAFDICPSDGGSDSSGRKHRKTYKMVKEGELLEECTAAIPAVAAERLVAAEESGKAAVSILSNPIKPSEIITEKSVENALRVLMAVSGSTNAVLHLAAVAGRRGIRISDSRLNDISEETPVLVDLKPVGKGYMEDFHAAGGVGGVLRELKPLLHLDTMNILGQTLEDRLRWCEETRIDWAHLSTIFRVC